MLHNLVFMHAVAPFLIKLATKILLLSTEFKMPRDSIPTLLVFTLVPVYSL